MKDELKRMSGWLLDASPVVMLLIVAAVFAAMSAEFRSWQNVENILVQSAWLAIAATGMTFVLLTAGIDLSIGAVMYLAGVSAGKLLLGDWPTAGVVGVMLLVGVTVGLFNALLINGCRLAPFIVTLATMLIGRGLGLWISETRPMNLPDRFQQLASGRVVGIPAPIVIMVAVLVAAQLLLTHTPLGRQIYAVGNDPGAARKAGINVNRILMWAYVLCGGCAALSSVVYLAQLNSVATTIGKSHELENAIAAAVIGGTSLFGGRGSVLPGALVGAVLIKTVYAGLIFLNVNPYIHTMITGGIVFYAVLLESLRQGWRETRRRIIRVVAQRPHISKTDEAS